MCRGIVTNVGGPTFDAANRQSAATTASYITQGELLALPVAGALDSAIASGSIARALGGIGGAAGEDGALGGNAALSEANDIANGSSSVANSTTGNAFGDVSMGVQDLSLEYRTSMQARYQNDYNLLQNQGFIPHNGPLEAAYEMMAGITAGFNIEVGLVRSGEDLAFIPGLVLKPVRCLPKF